MTSERGGERKAVTKITKTIPIHCHSEANPKFEVYEFLPRPQVYIQSQLGSQSHTYIQFMNFLIEIQGLSKRR